MGRCTWWLDTNLDEEKEKIFFIGTSSGYVSDPKYKIQKIANKFKIETFVSRFDSFRLLN